LTTSVASRTRSGLAASRAGFTIPVGDPGGFGGLAVPRARAMLTKDISSA
jgi:hypothetical protein